MPRVALRHMRVYLTVTVSPRTVERLDLLARTLGLARGRIVDQAVDCLDACESCGGAGGDADGVCEACGGARIVPRSL